MENNLKYFLAKYEVTANVVEELNMAADKNYVVAAYTLARPELDWTVEDCAEVDALKRTEAGAAIIERTAPDAEASYNAIGKAYAAWKKEPDSNNLDTLNDIYALFRTQAAAYVTMRGVDKLRNNTKLYIYVQDKIKDEDTGVESVVGYSTKTVSMALSQSDFTDAFKWGEYQEYALKVRNAITTYDDEFKEAQAGGAKTFGAIKSALIDVVTFLQTEFDIEERMKVNSTSAHAFVSLAIKIKTTKGGYTKTAQRQNAVKVQELIENFVRCMINGIDLTLAEKKDN